MKRILAVDSTSDILSISLSEGTSMLSEIKDDKSTRHMVNIMDDIDCVLKSAKNTINDVDLFALNLGPGDFTGGRIGISVIKIFSMLSGSPVFGFNSLDVFSAGCMLKNLENISASLSRFQPVHIIPVMDVRNNELYYGIYEAGTSRGNNPILSAAFRGRTYFLNKISGGFLVKVEDFNAEVSALINNGSVPAPGSFASGEPLGGNIPEKIGLDGMPADNEGDLSPEKEGLFIFTANAVKNYAEMFNRLDKALFSGSSDREIMIDEENFNPSSENLCMLADYAWSFKAESLPIAPVYVRDFVVFSRK
jgi:tRNA threonylcarbamoyl adenosine modification protein YeaZ